MTSNGSSIKRSSSRGEDSVYTTPTEIPGIIRQSNPRKQNTDIPIILPHEKVFPIQIGTELFRLSGASLSSDAPSYFSQFFQFQIAEAERKGESDCNAIRTLYIDRDPATFRDISLHLQGYHVSPRDASHFVKLFADAQFYSLPRLMSQLYEESTFITIGHTEFQVPRSLFSSPGNSPNYFTLGFAVFFSCPTEVFPGLDREGLLRPPSIIPPSVPGRSAETFKEILHLLRGYEVKIRGKEHREELLRDVRYFCFKGLEQRLIRHDISWCEERGKEEIMIGLGDVRQSGIGVGIVEAMGVGWVGYKRPFVDKVERDLVLEVGGECGRVLGDGKGGLKVHFSGEAKKRIGKLLEVILERVKGGMGLEVVLVETEVDGGLKCVIDDTSAVVLDGKEWFGDVSVPEDDQTENGEGTYGRKRRRTDGGVEGRNWIVETGLWRVRVKNFGDRMGRGVCAVEVALVGVKIDALSGEGGRNSARGFLGP